MDNKALWILSASVVGFLIKEIMDLYKSKHSKVETKIDELRADFSEIKTILLMTQAKYDESHKNMKDQLNNYYERLRDLEQQRQRQI